MAMIIKKKLLHEESNRIFVYEITTTSQKEPLLNALSGLTRQPNTSINYLNLIQILPKFLLYMFYRLTCKIYIELCVCASFFPSTSSSSSFFPFHPYTTLCSNNNNHYPNLYLQLCLIFFPTVSYAYSDFVSLRFSSSFAQNTNIHFHCVLISTAQCPHTYTAMQTHHIQCKQCGFNKSIHGVRFFFLFK